MTSVKDIARMIRTSVEQGIPVQQIVDEIASTDIIGAFITSKETAWWWWGGDQPAEVGEITRATTDEPWPYPPGIDNIYDEAKRIRTTFAPSMPEGLKTNDPVYRELGQSHQGMAAYILTRWASERIRWAG